MKKTYLENLLNSFSGEFREIFIENTKSVRLSMINGKMKTPFLWENKWYSILSRTWKKEFFDVVSGNIKPNQEEIDNFVDKFRLWKPEKIINLVWESEIKLENNIDLLADISYLADIIDNSYQNILSKHDIIKSSEIFIWLNSLSFIVANSSGNFSSDTLYYNTIYIKLIWEKNWNIEEIMEKISGINILDSIDQKKIDESFQNAINILKQVLEAKESPSWDMYVVIWNESWWTIIHEAIWHGLEADLQNSSAYRDKLWQKVASDWVTIIDNPTIKNLRWYYKVDHEWELVSETTLIENGILKTYLHNKKTSEKFKTYNTWHGRRQDYKYKTLVRMGNTYLAPWKDKKEELIKKVDKWIYVSKMWGWQVNITTGDFVFEVQNGYMIENWQISHSIRWATISGNGPEVLQNIYGICDDLVYFDHGTCGKGQAMPVSDACPTILTRLRVSGK